MDKKKRLETYLLLASEGASEYNLFSYLTKVRFKDQFDKSNIKFSDKVEIPKLNITKGKLNGFESYTSFQKKYKAIKKNYKDQKLFFILDNDIDDSPKIEKAINDGKDLLQFLEYNFEYLLLELSGKHPKRRNDFKSLKIFRNYCKAEFNKQFKKNGPTFKDQDFENIFKNVSDKRIKEIFSVLFDTLRQ